MSPPTDPPRGRVFLGKYTKLFVVAFSPFSHDVVIFMHNLAFKIWRNFALGPRSGCPDGVWNASSTGVLSILPLPYITSGAEVTSDVTEPARHVVDVATLAVGAK